MVGSRSAYSFIITVFSGLVLGTHLCVDAGVGSSCCRNRNVRAYEKRAEELQRRDDAPGSTPYHGTRQGRRVYPLQQTDSERQMHGHVSDDDPIGEMERELGEAVNAELLGAEDDVGDSHSAIPEGHFRPGRHHVVPRAVPGQAGRSERLTATTGSRRRSRPVSPPRHRSPLPSSNNDQATALATGLALGAATGNVGLGLVFGTAMGGL